jgi:vacuolar-type H+-ATPase subunit H
MKETLGFELEVQPEVQKKQELQTGKLETELVSPLVKKARELTVLSDIENSIAVEYLKSIKAASKKVKDFFAEPKQKAYEAHKSITARETEMLNPLVEAERTVKIKIAGFLDAQERIRREAEERAAKEAAKIEAEARKAMRKGDEEKAETLSIQAVMKIAEVQHIPQKTEGVFAVKRWNWKVIDMSLVPREYLVVNEKALNGLAKAAGNSVTVPGIEFYQETSISARSN